MAILIRLGDAADVDAAVSVYEQSNLARRQGVWPDQAARVEQVRAHLRDPSSWFLLAIEGPASVGVASAEALRGEDGAGPVIPGHCFLNLLFVLPKRWGEGIGRCWTLFSLRQSSGTTRGFTSGRTKTTSVRTVYIAVVASRQRAEPRMVRASGRERYDGVSN